MYLWVCNFTNEKHVALQLAKKQITQIKAQTGKNKIKTSCELCVF